MTFAGVSLHVGSGPIASGMRLTWCDVLSYLSPENLVAKYPEHAVTLSYYCFCSIWWSQHPWICIAKAIDKWANEFIRFFIDESLIINTYLVLSVFNVGGGPLCGGMAGGWSSVSRYRPSMIPLDCDGSLKTCASSSKLSPFASSSSGDGGNGGNPSVSSGLDDGGDGGSGPNMFWESNISLALSDLWTPARKPTGRRGGAISE